MMTEDTMGDHRDMETKNGCTNSPESRDRRTGRRRPLAPSVGPPLIDISDDTRLNNNSVKPSPLLSLPNRPSMPWGIGGWVMDLSMYEPPDEPSPTHIDNRTHWPRAFLDYQTTMEESTLVARGDSLVHLIRRECSERAMPANGPRQSKPVLRKTFDSARCLYVVHASVDLNASFDDVLSVLSDRSFLSHVFGHQMVASSELRRCGSTTSVVGLNVNVPRGYKRNQAMEIIYLDHVVCDRTSWTRAIKSIDVQSSVSKMTHLVAGLHLETLATPRLQPRCRLTFYGDSCMPSVLAVKTEGSNYFLDAFGQSVLLVQRIVRRRRHTHAPLTSPGSSVRRAGHKRCRICSKSFHLFRHAHSCRVCLARVCAECSDIEEIDSPDGMYVDDVVRICHGCRATTTSSPMGSPSSVPSHATIFQPMACHVCLQPFRGETSNHVQCCKVCDQNGCSSCGIFDEDDFTLSTEKRGSRGILWTCRRCLVPVRRSLSANYFSALEDEDEMGMPQLMLRRASFD